MLDRIGDYSGGRWRGRVVNVMDPKMQGRVQVRVVGLHDDEALIPDRDLPWAQVRMPINSGASLNGVSGSPVGVIPGTVLDGYYGDSDRTVFIATGTLLSAGKTIPGKTINGSYALDNKYNGVANAARGIDLNAALKLKNLPAISQIGAVFPSVSAGLGSLTTHSGNILTLLSITDPRNMSGAISGAVSGLLKNQTVYKLSSLANTFAGGMNGINATLALIQSGQLAMSAIPRELQDIINTYPGGLTSLALMATNLSSVNPASVIGGVVGAAISQAAAFVDITNTINSAISALTRTSMSRQYALEAAIPTPPPLPAVPTTTTASASTTPGSESNTDPWSSIESYVLPPPIITSSDFDSVLNTTTSVVANTVANNVNTETQSIMNQIDNQIKFQFDLA